MSKNDIYIIIIDMNYLLIMIIFVQNALIWLTGMIESLIMKTE